MYFTHNIIFSPSSIKIVIIMKKKNTPTHKEQLFRVLLHIIWFLWECERSQQASTHTQTSKSVWMCGIWSDWINIKTNYTPLHLDSPISKWRTSFSLKNMKILLTFTNTRAVRKIHCTKNMLLWKITTHSHNFSCFVAFFIQKHPNIQQKNCMKRGKIHNQQM